VNPVRFTLTTVAASANNIVTTITPTSGTALTLNGSTVTAGVATLDVARRVLLTFGNEASNRTLVVTGTDRSGNVQTETLAVASGAGGTIGTQRDFLTVTSALPLGGGWTAAATLGTSAIVSTPWFMREWGQIGRMGILIYVPTGSGATESLEVTWDDPNAALVGTSVEPTSQVPPLAVIAPATNAVFNPTTGVVLGTQAWTGLVAASNGGAGEFDVPVFAYRMTQTAGSGTGVLSAIETTADRKMAY
jgi:hypothetical protein